MKDFCVILVFNKLYLSKAFNTIQQLRKVGLYDGDIVCLFSSDLKNRLRNVENESTIAKYFPETNLSKNKKVHKAFQFHKFYCFHTWFKEKYKKCFYIDVGSNIFKPIDKIINLDCSNKLLAHSDSYPEHKWKLFNQFDENSEIFKILNTTYDLNKDYFQSTIMLYDTSIIKEDTFEKLVQLANTYPISKTNDQGILNLYFNGLFGYWKQIKIKDKETYYYDFWERDGLTKDNYIMLKYLR